ncbi:MAG: TonB-dependent receptor [Flavobacteriaceae bacterium]
MKKFVCILGVLFGMYQVSAQKKEKKETAKDTLDPGGVITVVTSYTPTIADAFKIKKNPKIVLSKKSEKKKLKYTIFSAPVASTFIPKSGVVKGIDLGVKERLYNNYAAVGFGNYSTPFVEVFLHQNTKFESDFGIYAKYISSENGIDNTVLNNGYRNLNLGAYYMQEERYFNWKVGFDIENNQYNWYGLPSLPFNVGVTNAIEEEQKYTYYALNGEMIFEDAYIESANAKIYSFSDDYKSKELFFSLSSSLKFPLTGLSRKLNDLNVNTSFAYLNGKFAQNYFGNAKEEYSFFNFKVNPVYRFGNDKLKIKAGTKLYVALDTQNSLTDFFIYPDVEISYPIVKGIAYLGLGANGDLEMNTYKNYSDINPFVSPTLFMTQTNTQYNLFARINGKFSSNVTYEIKGSYQSQEDKPLFVRNNSKSDGTVSVANSIPLLGYEYGNSFNVFYDDVKTFSIYTELEVEVSKRMVIGANAQINSYTTASQQEAWNLPKLEGAIYGKYKKDKWYAGADLFFVGERKDVMYTSIYPSTFGGIQNLKSYIDLNLNGGYHFSDMLSAFIKFNNVLNTDYQRYANFNVLGFQVLAGVTYKFDF